MVRNRNISVFFLAICILCLLAATTDIFLNHGYSGKLSGTAGIFLSVAAAFQLKVSTFVEDLPHFYGDENEFPSGPPSHVMREYCSIDNPDAGLISRSVASLFLETRVGHGMLVLAGGIELIAIWL